MKLSFHGATRTVTGTKHLVTLENGNTILLDCGLFQGMGQQTDKLNAEFGFNPETISFVLLSHAHIDHSGLLPKLVKEGFKGKIYCTPATQELTRILLYDSAEIQAYEAESLNKKRISHRLTLSEPLYTTTDVDEAMTLFEPVEFNEPFTPMEEIEVIFTNTGHLVGSAAIHLTITEKGKTTRLLFSGDVGRYRSVLWQPPAEPPQADYIILESTYGDKHHDIRFNTIKTINQWIQKTCINKGGKLIIPAFSVGRTQEVLYALNQLELEKRLPPVNYYVDSPLSLKATAAVKKYTEHFNDRLQQVLRVDNDPFEFTGLKYIETVEDSQRLMQYSEPCVIISASGTGDAGRVKHHLFSCIGQEKNSVLLVGYCSAASLGGQLLEGTKEVELFGDSCTVAADVGKLDGMSAHGDCNDLTQFLNSQDTTAVKGIFLVHGEYTVQQQFAGRLERKEFKRIEIPEQHQVFEL